MSRRRFYTLFHSVSREAKVATAAVAVTCGLACIQPVRSVTSTSTRDITTPPPSHSLRPASPSAALPLVRTGGGHRSTTSYSILNHFVTPIFASGSGEYGYTWSRRPQPLPEHPSRYLSTYHNIDKSPLDAEVKSALRQSIDKILREREVACRVNVAKESDMKLKPAGVAGFHHNSLASNDPIEDRHSESVFVLHPTSEEKLNLPGRPVAQNSWSQSWFSFGTPRTERKASDVDKAPASDQAIGFFGIFDGHGGWQCSEVVHRLLPNYVMMHARKQLSPQQSPETKKTIPFKELTVTRQCLESAFSQMDADLKQVAQNKDGPWFVAEAAGFLQNVFQRSSTAPRSSLAMEAILPAMAGCVGILACVTSANIFVANTGDCRAVLGVKDGSSGSLHIKALPLSTDHTARNPKERERIQADHSNEDISVLLRRNRILGSLEPTRAFGDGRYKWTAEALLDIQSFFSDLIHSERTQFDLHPSKDQPTVWPPRQLVSVVRRMAPPADYQTPPYVTAHPEVTHYTRTGNESFIILATDGLWEHLSSEEAVEIVSRVRSEYSNASSSPVTMASNAATQLLRYALASSRPGDVFQDPCTEKATAKIDLTSDTATVTTGKLLSIPAPFSRRFRDDITVTVVFLEGEDGKTSRDLQVETWSEEMGLSSVDPRRWNDVLEEKLRHVRAKL